MPANRQWTKILRYAPKKKTSWLRSLITGSLFRISSLRSDSSITNIKTQIDTMRALASDSQISTALSYYATDATIPNSEGHVLWATAIDDTHKEVAEIVNELIKRWKIDEYARDHILELATIGNLYIPTTYMYRDEYRLHTQNLVSLDNNTIPDSEFDIIPSYKIPPEDICHLFELGQPSGYILQPEANGIHMELHPEASCIHFSLGGLLGDYTIETRDNEGRDIIYDIKFATPMMDKATQPTQTLNLLEDANILSSLARTIKFINVECGNAEEEQIQGILLNLKDTIEQNLSINTNDGDAQSYVNPQSPNNLIYLPRVKGQDAISITDLNMAENNEADNKLLQYYQDKKLSVIGVPKEYMNFSATEGLGGAGSVLSQRSAIYANSLQRLKQAYISGWTDAINTYFKERGVSNAVDQFELHMADIITTQSTIQFEKRDSAVSQAQSVVDLLKNLGVKDVESYKKAITEVLLGVLPSTSAEVFNWDIDVNEPSEGGLS